MIYQPPSLFFFLFNFRAVLCSVLAIILVDIILLISGWSTTLVACPTHSLQIIIKKIFYVYLITVKP